MPTQYETIIGQNLAKIFGANLERRAYAMGAHVEGHGLDFTAFGAACRITPDGIRLDGSPQTGPLGIVISLYALHANEDACKKEPFRAFKEFPNSMPYVGAFASHTEQPLVPLVDCLLQSPRLLTDGLAAEPAPAHLGGDGAWVIPALPKIYLCYIVYGADEDFPASATCLISHNAHRFLPMDALADTGEYSSRAIITLLKSET